MVSTPRISVVIPTFQRLDLLRRCLDAVAAQSLSPENFELIVADDGPSILTRDAVQSFKKDVTFAVHYVPVHRTQGPAGARNAGWRAARGTIIAFTDDDTIPDQHWLQEGWQAFQDATVAAIWGQIVVPLPSNPTDYEWDAAGLSRAEFATANCFCRRQILETVGGFDERFTAAWREDSDLYFSILECGLKVIQVPSAQVVHPVRQATWGVSVWQQKKSQFNALLYKKHPYLYWKKIQARPPWAYYGIFLALVALPAGALSGFSSLSWSAFAIWLILTGRFLSKRLRHTSREFRHVLEMLFTSLIVPVLSVYWRLRGAFRFRVLFF
jgi:glycosyltransferase involved in cell wall biosynthesis